MKYFTGKNVYDAALDRIRWLYSEFDNVMVSFSGGKDSTVIFHLTLQVARELGRLPLPVMFIDQEAEWAATIEQVRYVMTHPDVKPYWYQIPIRLFNATSPADPWLDVWGEASRDKWMREREPYSIHENTYGEDRFTKMFNACIGKDQPPNTANIGGIRCEESPRRHMSMTTWPRYKWITYAKHLTKQNQWTFYPIYDWTYLDVWKAIHDNGWPYCKLYDIQYQYGVQLRNMRVSNLHHETAITSLFYLQEAEPETYEKLTQRLGGIDMAGKLGFDDYFPSSLPPVFKNWREYRDYLNEKLTVNEEWRESFKRKFESMDKKFGDAFGDVLYRTQISSILTSDWEFIKLLNFEHNGATQERLKKHERENGAGHKADFEAI